MNYAETMKLRHIYHIINPKSEAEKPVAVNVNSSQ